MSKLLVILFILTFTLSFVGCNSQNVTVNSKENSTIDNSSDTQNSDNTDNDISSPTLPYEGEPIELPDVPM